jgi:hypothetical protein
MKFAAGEKHVVCRLLSHQLNSSLEDSEVSLEYSKRALDILADEFKPLCEANVKRAA